MIATVAHMTDAPRSLGHELVLVANAGESTISVFTLDQQTQRLTLLATSPVGRGCSTFAVDPDRDLIYAAAKPQGTDDAPRIDTFSLDRRTGILNQRHARQVDGTLAYLDLAPSGRLLAGASYHDGFAATWRVDDHGSVSPMVARVEWPNAHCVRATATNLYVVSLGADVIAQYALESDGALTPLAPATVAAPAGSGPRHLVIAADESTAHVVTEFTAQLLTYHRDDTGVLGPAGTQDAYATNRGLAHSRFGADPTAGHLRWGADVHLARGGRVVLASERTESTLSALPVDSHGIPGRASALVNVVPRPRGFAVTSDGRFAVIAGEAGSDVELLAIGTDGSLTSVGRTVTGAAPNWVRCLAPRGGIEASAHRPGPGTILGSR